MIDYSLNREALRTRFRNVILMAGYKNPEPILAEYFEKYLENIPEFTKMLSEYEEDYKDRSNPEEAV